MGAGQPRTQTRAHISSFPFPLKCGRSEGNEGQQGTLWLCFEPSNESSSSILPISLPAASQPPHGAGVLSVPVWPFGESRESASSTHKLMWISRPLRRVRG